MTYSLLIFIPYNLFGLCPLNFMILEFPTPFPRSTSGCDCFWATVVHILP